MKTELRKQAAADPWLLVVLAVLVAVTGALAAGSTAWLRVTADEMFSRLRADTPRAARMLTVRISGSWELPTYTDTELFGRKVAGWLDPPLPRAVGAPRVAVLSPQLSPQPVTPDPGIVRRHLTVASLPELPELVNWTAGRPPRPGARRQSVPAEIEDALRARSTPNPRARVIEIGLTRQAAEALGMPPGTYAKIRSIDGTSAGQKFTLYVMVKVTGIYEPAAPAPTRLDDVPLIREPRVTGGGIPQIYATALAASTDTILGTHWIAGPLTTQWTFPPGAALSAANASELRKAVDRLDITADTRVDFSRPSFTGPVRVEVVTGLDELAQRFMRQRGSSDAVLLGPRVAVLACALLTLALGARVLSTRRQRATGLLRARGGSLAQLMARRGVEAALLAVLGFVAGLGAAAGIAGGLPALQDVVAAAAAAAACAVVLTAVGATPAPASGRGERVRRIAGDACQVVVVALAAPAAWVLAGRDAVAADDPLVALTPVLVAAAAAVLGMRVVGFALAWLRRAVGAGRGLTGTLGLGRAVALTRAFALPAAGVVLAMAVGAVSVAVAGGLAADAERTARERVGADVAVRARALPGSAVDRIAQLAGVDTLAAVAKETDVSLARQSEVTLLVTDLDSLSRLYDRGPGRNPLADLAEPDAAVLASPELTGSGTLVYGGQRIEFQVSARVRALPGLTVDGQFLLVDRAVLRSAMDQPPRADVVLVDGAVGRDAVATALRVPTATVVSTSAMAAELADQPAVLRTVSVLRGGLLAAAVFAALGVTFAVLLTATSRRRTSSLLRVLGASRRQSVAASAAELAVTSVVAALVGGATAWALLRLLDFEYALRPLTALAPDLGTEQAVTVVTVAAVVLALAGSGLATAVTARASPRVVTTRGTEARDTALADLDKE